MRHPPRRTLQGHPWRTAAGPFGSAVVLENYQPQLVSRSRMSEPSTSIKNKHSFFNGWNHCTDSEWFHPKRFPDHNSRWRNKKSEKMGEPHAWHNSEPQIPSTQLPSSPGTHWEKPPVVLSIPSFGDWLPIVWLRPQLDMKEGLVGCW